MRPFRDELEEQGYQVTALRNADEALKCLELADDIDLVITDVMIGTASSQHSCFGREETEGFLITGLVLIDKLMKNNDKKLSKHLIIFSMAHQGFVIEKIEDTAKEYDIQYLRKSDYADPYEFCKKLAELELIKLKS
jgi:CheY-like chemotaxis protein